MLNFFLILSSILLVSESVNPGPLVIATKGEVWPKPQDEEKSTNYYIIRTQDFIFKGSDDIDCQGILDDAFTRYWNIIDKSNLRKLPIKNRKHTKLPRVNDDFLGYLEVLNVEIENECTDDIKPKFGDNENYTLTIDNNGATLFADTFWGVLRGLETFSQLIYLQENELLINATTINDFPKLPHRGLLIDTSRHFIPVDIILQNLDAMTYNKLNVFHWHLTDDQSFPYRSLIYPDLSEKGAYHPVAKVYHQSEISKVIEYARVRGIRVIPEFDTPGHTASWGVAYPELLTVCYDNNEINGELGPMDPTKNSTYTFLSKLFTEIVGVFPDEYFHIGGDEVDFTCWESNPDVNEFMEAHNFSTYEQVESYFIQNVVDILDSLKSKYLVWEEVFVNGVSLPDSTLVHVWRDNGSETLYNVTAAGKYAIFSSCWYLDHIEWGGDWQKYYDCEALDFPGTDEQKQLVLGGEACMWSESVNEYNIIPRIWPRASAAAEKLWSAIDVADFEAAQPRLEEHTCRMNFRGIAAQPPNGPGVCL